VVVMWGRGPVVVVLRSATRSRAAVILSGAKDLASDRPRSEG